MKQYPLPSSLPRLLLLFCFSLWLLPLWAEESSLPKKQWLPDYKQKVGFTYGLGAEVTANYIWRGLRVGGFSVHANANVGYGGFFVDMWCNVGTTNWKWLTVGDPVKFNPEVDLSIGFSRWGLTVLFMHMYYFDKYPDGRPSCFFDFKNHAPDEGGTTCEWRIGYRVSDQLPLSILFCTRTWGRDGYYKDGVLTRAYSSYIELGYDFNLPYQFCIKTRLGMTPSKSLYTEYRGNFAVCNVSAGLNWRYEIAKHCVMEMYLNLMLNPYDMSTGYTINGKETAFLWDMGIGFYLK